MNKIYKVGDVAYYNSPYFEKLGIEIEILKLHKIKDYKNKRDNIYYYSAKRLNGGDIKKYIHFDDIFDTKEKAILIGKQKRHELLKNVSKNFFSYYPHNY